MKGKINPKILGSTVVGIALVAGAYTLTNFGESKFVTQEATVISDSKTQRVIIDIEDNDGDGLEDWRDDFVVAAPVVLNTATTTYTQPDTITGQMAISLLEEAITARASGPFGTTDQEIITEKINALGRATNQRLYSIKDIDVFDNWNDQDVVNYANTISATIYNHSVPEIENELSLLRNILNSENEEESVADLIKLTKVYEGYLEDTLKIPVPKYLAKEHLDLINSYSAIYGDIDAMSKVLQDPALTLLRLRRYEDDATGLYLSMQNMYLAFEPLSPLFSKEDPVTVFNLFSPDYKI